MSTRQDDKYHKFGSMPNESLLYKFPKKDKAGSSISSPPSKRIVANQICSLCKLVVNIITAMWRAQKNTGQEHLENVSGDIKKLYRHCQAIWDLLTDAGFAIREYTDDLYRQDMAIEVIAYESIPDCNSATIVETIKPKILYKKQIIQKSQVIVALPPENQDCGKNNLGVPLRTNSREMCSSNASDLLDLFAGIATNLWKIKNRKDIKDCSSISGDLRKAFRHYETAWDLLANEGFEIRDHINKKYVAGMALKVIAFQPSSSVHIEMISETIKPSIFYNDKLIQMGEVIVKTPEKIESKESNKIKDVCEHKRRDTK